MSFELFVDDFAIVVSIDALDDRFEEFVLNLHSLLLQLNLAACEAALDLLGVDLTVLVKVNDIKSFSEILLVDC